MSPDIGAAIDQLKLKLIDLSKRNRLINYRPTAVSTIAVVDELPAEVFRILAIQGKVMRFRPVRMGDEIEVMHDGEAGEILLPAAEMRIKENPADRHLDLWLQTRLPADRLERSLRRIADQAGSVLEEQGVNALFLALGMLTYYESQDSNEARRAPLLLLPVTLERKAAGQIFSLKVAEDDPVVNPALAELLRSQFGISLPELPEITDDLDIPGVFAEMVQAVRSQPRWGITTDIVLGLFSFHKFVMFKDLERHKAVFAQHRLLRTLVERQGALTSGLPSDIAQLDLDQKFCPEQTFQVVDADSSQQRAIAAVAHNHDLVIEGPPGTGKSQTITNLIANALAAGKRILFVSEKMAALQVVFSRLDSAGLRNFCLELHSRMANKKAFLAEIGRSIDATLSVPPEPPSVGPQLRRLRGTLSNYAQAVHTPIEPLGWSPYRAFGELEKLAGASTIQLKAAVSSVSGSEFDDTCRAVQDLASTARALGNPSEHPWRDVGLEYLDAETRRLLAASLEEVEASCAEFVDSSAVASEAFGLGRVDRVIDAEQAAELADLLEDSPGAEVGVLTSPDWNSPPPLALELIAVGKRYGTRRDTAMGRFVAQVMERSHGTDIATITRLAGKFYRMFVGEYRRVRREWMAIRKPGYQATLGVQAEHLKEVDLARDDADLIARHQSEAVGLFGTSWRGLDSDWPALEAYVNWVVRFREICVEQGLARRAAEQGSQPHPKVDLLRRFTAAGADVAQSRQRLSSILKWPDGYLADDPVRDLAKRVQLLKSAQGGHNLWHSYVAAQDLVSTTSAASLVPLIHTGELDTAQAVRAFRRAFIELWTDDAVRGRPLLRDFSAIPHEERVLEFRDLDRKALKDNRIRIQRLLNNRVQEELRTLATSPGMTHLRGQIVRGRGHAPLRKTLHHSHEVIRAVKPCFMMSPITVAQFLDPTRHKFDLVIFDEASQLTAEDAVGAIVRGDRLVVVGDPKQLPPTNFFNVQSGQTATGIGDGADGLEDFESILEQFMAAGVASARLRWHYRSRHESLIAFSNLTYYHPPGLLTFPSADVGNAHRGLQIEFIPEGVYEGSGLNPVEARRVAEAVMEHARTNPQLSLGVGTFNLRQQIAIQDELERLRRETPELESFFAPKVEGGFFVKNLENIQGDDRDVIFLSVTYAKGPDGKLRHNFGPLNGQNGWRRLNVLITRSRLRMNVFSSMHGDDIDLTKTQAQGARNLRDFLLFAERGSLVGVRAEAADTESPFETEVLAELTRRGVRLVPQVGVAGYRIDFGVLDDKVEGRFVCGIECDGALYHSAETARDRDRLRQEVLEGLGWTLHRIWSTDWFKDRAATIQRLVAAIERSREEARGKPRRAQPKEDRAHSGASALGTQLNSTPAQTTPISAPIMPKGQRYQFAQLSPDGARGTMSTSEAVISELIEKVVTAEAPVHEEDVISRVSNVLGDQRAGSRITGRLETIILAGARAGRWERGKGFLYVKNGTVKVRSREGTGIPGERIAPDEYVAAVRLVLASNGAQPREAVINMVREVFGFARTGDKLLRCINQAIDILIADGQLGQGSGGLALRR